MAGVIDPWAGTITLDDDDLTHLPSHRTLGRGLAMMPQGGGVFPQLSVRDNLRIGGYTIRPGTARPADRGAARGVPAAARAV